MWVCVCGCVCVCFQLYHPETEEKVWSVFINLTCCESCLTNPLYCSGSQFDEESEGRGGRDREGGGRARSLYRGFKIV